ncbi:coil containing protein [Vibrio phage 1.170.O._10N.261.52.C3]|nr:coil containing protein [Vibrio phage 1.170.O._10N.261.52.C3]
MYQNINKNFPEITESFEVLMSYPIGKIFTSDTPSGKEKKLEQRCTKLVDSYYSIESIRHQRIRSLLHDLDATLLLFGYNGTDLHLLRSVARLEKEYEDYRKLIQKTVKQEKPLVDYYSCLGKVSWFKVSVDFCQDNYLECQLDMEGYGLSYKGFLKDWDSFKESY